MSCNSCKNKLPKEDPRHCTAFSHWDSEYICLTFYEPVSTPDTAEETLMDNNTKLY